eukprot:scaffold43095_cov27-Tisochrysis_lutea.AAC.5
MHLCGGIILPVFGWCTPARTFDGPHLQEPQATATGGRAWRPPPRIGGGPALSHPAGSLEKLCPMTASIAID